MHAQDEERIAAPRAARRGGARPLLFALLALLVVGALVLMARELLRATPAPGVDTDATRGQPPASAPTPPAAAAPETVLPGEAPLTGESLAPPLPALAESDTEVRVALAAILPAPLHPSLAPGDLLRRAATIADGFGRGKLVRDKLPLPAVPGKLIVVERDGRIFLDPANYARYDSLAAALAGLDIAALANWYARYEPLLQQAYEELGNGDARVRDAILRGLDTMLATAAPEGEPELKQPAVFYKYANPALEALPDAQKLLIRMGPANRAIVLTQLGRLRAALGS